jgi:hypothetical protein
LAPLHAQDRKFHVARSNQEIGLQAPVVAGHRLLPDRWPWPLAVLAILGVSAGFWFAVVAVVGALLA